MNFHKQFGDLKMSKAIFDYDPDNGYEPEYSDRYDLTSYLSRLVILSAAFLRAYYCKKKNGKVNMTSRTLDKIVARPYLSLDNCISVLTAFQSNGEEIEELGLNVSVKSEASGEGYINLYEVKSVVNAKTVTITPLVCREILQKVFNCISFIKDVAIKNENDSVSFAYEGEEYGVGDLLKYDNYGLLYLTVKDVDPLETEYVML